MTLWNQVIVLLLVVDYFADVDAKGAKVRPAKRPGGRDRPSRYPAGSSSSSSDSASGGDSLRYLTEYQFRNATYEERLLAYLFSDYDPVARAVVNTDQPVVVRIDFVLLRIHGLEERGQVLTTTGLIIAEWTDARLEWKPEKFGNLTDIILRADKIWQPELAIMNGAEELVPDFDRIRVMLRYDGQLHWEPGGIFKTTCDIDIAYFPFDTQHCPIIVGAYSYYSVRMNITNVKSTMSTHEFQENGEWEVGGSTAEWNVTVLACCPSNGYAHVVFTLSLRRRYKFYLMNIVLPCLMLSALILVGFLLPPDAGEKISLGISVLLAFTVFLLMIADSIPRTSLAIPLIVVYLMATMTLGAISVCMTVVVLNLHHKSSCRRLPRCARRFVLVHLARLLRVDTADRRAYVADQVWKRRVDYIVPLCGTSTVEANGFQTTKAAAAKSASSTCFNCFSACRWSSKPAVSGGSAVVRKRSASKIHQARRRSPSAPKRRPSAVTTDLDDNTGWKEVAQVVDRLFFWIIFILMTMSTVSILLYPMYTGVPQSKHHL